VAAIVFGLILGEVGRSGSGLIVKGIAALLLSLCGAWVTTLSISVFIASMGGATGLTLGAFLGALVGVLGPEIERRTVPNQGIRQSAFNVAVFFLLGALVLGLPFGVMNVLFAAVWLGLSPDALDWIHFGLGAALFIGLLGGLVPGAACIQHYTLRAVLWTSGSAPWRYAQFLNYATERMLLQRIGGRYRFIHELLRDHFAAIQPSDSRLSESKGGGWAR